MKRSFVVILILFLCIVSLFASKEWYKEKGTLHTSTVKEWRYGSIENKLVTSGDWLASTTWKNSIKTIRDFDRLKLAAANLVVNIDYTIADLPELDTQKVNEIAVLLLTLSDEFNPEYY